MPPASTTLAETMLAPLNLMFSDVGMILWLLAFLGSGLAAAYGLVSIGKPLRLAFTFVCSWTLYRILAPLGPPAAVVAKAVPPPHPAAGGGVSTGLFVAVALIFALPALSWAIIKACEMVRKSIEEPEAPAVEGTVLGVGKHGVTVLTPDGRTVEVLRDGGVAYTPVSPRPPAPAPKPQAGAFTTGCNLHSHRSEVTEARRRIEDAFAQMRELGPLGRKPVRLLRRLDEDVGRWLLELPKAAPGLTDNMKASLAANVAAAEALAKEALEERIQRADVGAKVNRDRHQAGDLS